MNPLLRERNSVPAAEANPDSFDSGFLLDSLVARVASIQKRVPEVPVKRRLVDLQTTVVSARLNPENKELWADALVGFLHAALASGFTTDEIMLAAHNKFDREFCQRYSKERNS